MIRKLIPFVFFLMISWSLNILADDYSFDVWAKNGTNHQSAANHGRYLFFVQNMLSSISLYDLDNKKMIYSLSLKPRDDKRGSIVVYHCNQCCFGKEKYQDDDMFPLLYISQRNANDSTGAFLDVLRIIPFLDDKKQIDSFRVEQVQKVFLPVMTDRNSMGNPNAVIDSDDEYLYTYSRNNRPKAPNFRQAVITKFHLPSIRDINGKIQSEIFLTDSDILDSFNCEFNLLNAQGGFYRNGKIYIVQGHPSKNEKLNYVYFREIDLRKKKLVKTVDMLNNGFRSEPEGCWYYNGSVMVGGYKKRIYKLTGKKYKVK